MFNFLLILFPDYLHKETIDRLLQALGMADRLKCSSAAVLLDEEMLKKGYSWMVFQMCFNVLKDPSITHLKHVRIVFETEEMAGILIRRIRKEKNKLWRNSTDIKP